jgi:hypothetical protein
MGIATTKEIKKIARHDKNCMDAFLAVVANMGETNHSRPALAGPRRSGRC